MFDLVDYGVIHGKSGALGGEGVDLVDYGGLDRKDDVYNDYEQVV